VFSLKNYSLKKREGRKEGKEISEKQKRETRKLKCA